MSDNYAVQTLHKELENLNRVKKFWPKTDEEYLKSKFRMLLKEILEIELAIEKIKG